MTRLKGEISEAIKACKKGDHSAFRMLYDSYKNSLFAICLRYVSDRMEAEDMLQEAFILIFKNISSYDSEKGSFYTWSSKIVVNTILGKLRKNKPLLVFQEQVPKKEHSSVDLPIHDLSMKELVQQIQSLPEGYRRIFNMYVIDGMKHREIAKEMDISVSTSKTQLMYAKRAMQKKISEMHSYSQVN